MKENWPDGCGEDRKGRGSYPSLHSLLILLCMHTCLILKTNNDNINYKIQDRTQSFKILYPEKYVWDKENRQILPYLRIYLYIYGQRFHKRNNIFPHNWLVLEVLKSITQVWDYNRKKGNVWTVIFSHWSSIAVKVLHFVH